MSLTQERFRANIVGVNTSITVNSNALGGFLCKTSGTIRAVHGINNVVAIDDFPVTSGQYYPLPFLLGANGGIFTTAGGASGTLGVA